MHYQLQSNAIMFIWILFLILIVSLLALDLGIFNKTPHAPSIKESAIWTVVWISVAVIFSILIYFIYDYKLLDANTHGTSGYQAFVEFITAYLVEKSLSLDNIFVMAVIFSYFGIPQKYQHRVLFWGILGALVFRGAMIAAGSILINSFDWTIVVFGILLIISALKLMFMNEKSFNPDDNKLVKIARKIYHVITDVECNKFIIKKHGIKYATPFLLSLVCIESSDIMFAFDSIPAVFAVTSDSFIVFTSNVFAILGLRSLYFVLISMINKFHYLQKSLVIVLLFIGIKMVVSNHYHIHTTWSLLIIAAILSGGVALSMFKSKPAN